MKPAPFEYRRASSIDDAIEGLAGGNGSAKLIAGGQSLGPMLNLRLSRPDLLIDITDIAELKHIEQKRSRIFIGAAVTHASIEDGILGDAGRGLMQAVARRIAYRAVRNRGTIGGSLAHADPAADWMLALTALDGSVSVRGPNGERSLSVATLMRAPFTTALSDQEMIVGIEMEKPSPAALWAHYKFCRKVGKFAEAAAAVIVDKKRGVCRIVVGTSDAAPILLDEFDNRLLDTPGKLVQQSEIADVLRKKLSLHDDFDRQLRATVVARALSQLAPL